LDSRRKFRNSKISFSRSRNTNCRFRIWWIYTANSTATEEYDGTAWTAGGNMNTARRLFSRSRNSNSRTCFWWIYRTASNSN
jgi:hypothetical protein